MIKIPNQSRHNDPKGAIIIIIQCAILNARRIKLCGF